MSRNWLVCLLALHTLAGAPATRPMVIYDSLLSYKDKPDTAKLGMRAIHVTGNDFWRNDDTSKPDESACRALGAKVDALHCPLVIDIEHWPWDVRSDPPDKVDETIAKFTDIVRWCRTGAKEKLQIGVYGMPPLREYWAVVSNDAAALQKWRDGNAKWSEFAKQVDLIFPSLYTFYGPGDTADYRDDWVKYASANIDEAKRYGKPVAAFLWPRYHTSNAKLKHTFIDGDFFRLELQTCRDAGIDVVIWDWSGFDEFKPFDFSVKDTWWSAVKELSR